MVTGIDFNFYFLGRLAEYLKVGNPLTFVEELLGDKELILLIEESVKNVPEFETKKFAGPFDFRFYRIVLYCLTRELKPAVFVETGVLHGLSSFFILRAMKVNGTGQLISVDLPSYKNSGPANKDGYNATLPDGKEPGWTIPEHHRSQWALKLEKSQTALPKIFKSHPHIDIFCHDSEHSYLTMWEEMNLAWPHIREGGILICDNVDANPSFFDFCRKVDRLPILLPAPDSKPIENVRFAILRK